MQTLLQATKAYTLLENEGKENRFSHAYLLTLNDRKNLRLALKTFALLFFDCAKADTPEKKRIAERIKAENFSDCLFFPNEDKKLTVEDAEKIQEESTLNPIEAEKKLFVIGDFSDATPQFQNKLLKLLEEPPKNVYFLLGASTAFSVLSTVLSRTKKLEIQPFSPEQITQVLVRLYGNTQEKSYLLVCAATANGSVGEAQDIIEGGFYKNLKETAFSLVLCPLSKLPSLTKQIGETRHQKELLSMLRLIYRDALILKTQVRNLNGKLFLTNEKENLLKVSEKYPVSALLYAQEAITLAEKQVKFNAVFPQCIEICISNIRNKK